MKKQDVVLTTLQLDKETVRKLDQLAVYEDRSRSSMVRTLVREAYEKHEKAVAESLTKPTSVITPAMEAEWQRVTKSA